MQVQLAMKDRAEQGLHREIDADLRVDLVNYRHDPRRVAREVHELAAVFRVLDEKERRIKQHDDDRREQRRHRRQRGGYDRLHVDAR
ncbi:hypothetical protein [Paraburkholderia sp. 35.1]|uniref:hypothetical protein n=1 Tax=Paraburkholderia sp. 35.1 TaxID=2991058 RepID=UPI003D1D5BB8